MLGGMAGRISGVVLCGGALSSSLSVPLVSLTTRELGGDYTPVNVVGLLLALLSLHMPYYAWRQERAAAVAVVAVSGADSATRAKHVGP